MENSIRLHLSDLNGASFEKLSETLRKMSGKANPEIILTVNPENDKDLEYMRKVETSLAQLRNGQSRTFTMEEFETYLHDLIKE